MDYASSAASTVRNSVAYPAGRFVRNTAVPYASQKLANVATGTYTFARNSALPYAGQKLKNAATGTYAFTRNSALPYVGQKLKNAANFTRKCVGKFCTRRRAAKGLFAFDTGLEITENDRTILAGILSLTPDKISEQKELLADSLENDISDYVLDNNIDELTAEQYKELAQVEFSASVKGLVMIHLGSMGRDAETPSPVPVYLAANILAQAHKLPSAEMEYDNVVSSNAELAAKIAEYNAAHANDEHFKADGGRRKRNGRKSGRKSTRRNGRKSGRKSTRRNGRK